MVNPFGGTRLDEPLVYRLEFPIRHMCRTYSELRFKRRASMEDVQISSRISDPRKSASVVLARMAKVPKAVIDKMHPKDLFDLMNVSNPLFEMV